MSIEQNKALIHRWVDEVLNAKDTASSDGEALIAHDFVGHLAGFPAVEGHEAYRQLGAAYFSAFPDIHFTIEDMLAEEDKVVIRYTTRATHRGELMGILPTGKQVTVSGISIYRIASGKIVEEWDSYDNLGVMQQLGSGLVVN